MFGIVVSPRAIEKRPLTTSLVIRLVGGPPATLVASWLQKVVVPRASTRANLKKPWPSNGMPSTCTKTKGLMIPGTCAETRCENAVPASVTNKDKLRRENQGIRGFVTFSYARRSRKLFISVSKCHYQ